MCLDEKCTHRSWSMKEVSHSSIVTFDLASSQEALSDLHVQRQRYCTSSASQTPQIHWTTQVTSICLPACLATNWSQTLKCTWSRTFDTELTEIDPHFLSSTWWKSPETGHELLQFHSLKECRVLGGELTKTLPPQIPPVPSVPGLLMFQILNSLIESALQHHHHHHRRRASIVSSIRGHRRVRGKRKTELQTHQTQLGLGGFNF